MVERGEQDLTAPLALGTAPLASSVAPGAAARPEALSQGLASPQAGATFERTVTDGFVESLPGLFYLYDRKGNFLRWNRHFETVSEYAPAEIARMHPLEFFAEEDRELLTTRIQEVFDQGEASIEAPLRTKSGRRVPHLFTGKRLWVDGQECLVGVGVDLSTRRQAEEALAKTEARFKSTLDSILEGCQILAFDWTYLYLNEAAAIHNRRPNTELLGRRMADIWPGIDTTNVFAMLERCMKERVALHDEVDFVFPDGSRGWFDVRAQPVPEGIFVLSIDISERKRAEHALRHLNESLELRIAERTRELEIACARAESADRLKSTFLATMSHELRTPLNSIIGFTGVLLQKLAGPLNDEQAKQLGMVQGSARHLLALINDVLDISKIEAGQLEVQPQAFDVRESVERTVATIRPLAQKKSLTLDFRLAADVSQMTSDKRRVEQIMLNLLSNAVKFTDRGGVSLSVELIDNGANVKNAIEDTGVGIKSDDLSTLFQPFRQLDAGLERQHEGSGLGLAICRRLTLLLGGTISAQSLWERGSVFVVVLPREGGGLP